MNKLDKDEQRGKLTFYLINAFFFIFWLGMTIYLLYYGLDAAFIAFIGIPWIAYYALIH